MADNIFSFLVTTDNHMGYKEGDHIRRRDSYMAFEEALKIARDRDVDFILLGGDLFHMNRPSASIEHKCIKIIRRHMNAKVDRSISFSRIAGDFSHFRKLNHANFEDKNLKVPYPIMTIHGNHDDPTGPNAQSVCEKLATCGLLNYFGAIQETEMKDITIKPIVLQKGQIKIALYGLGFIPDYKLKMIFDKGQLVFEQPPNDTFNVLVVHQNRVPFNKNKYIPDDSFPTFFHLIIRGHEHSTQSPEPIPESGVKGMVYQPGSTVATSISMMEAAPKKVGLISVRVDNPKGNQATLYKMDYELIDIKCCRRMLMVDIRQKDIHKHIKSVTGSTRFTSDEFKKCSEAYVEKYIQELLDKFASNSQDSENSNLESKLSRFDLPLMRVRLEYTSKKERFDELYITSKFYPAKVANKDIIMFKKQKLQQSESGEMENVTFINEDDEEDDLDDYECINLGEEKRNTIETMIENYFKDQPPHMRLQALSLSEYTNAVKGASEDGNVISKVLSKKKKEMLDKYQDALGDEEMVALKFHDEDKVHKWFITAFSTKDPMMGGDEEMDIVWEDGLV